MQWELVSQSELETVEGGMMPLREPPDFTLPEEPDGGLAYRVNFSYWSGEYVFLP